MEVNVPRPQLDSTTVEVNDPRCLETSRGGSTGPLRAVKLGGNLITRGTEWNRGWAGASPLPYELARSAGDGRETINPFWRRTNSGRPEAVAAYGPFSWRLIRYTGPPEKRMPRGLKKST
ncbi:hypothetical protein Bbelb_260350 [Branchiostoma belcheri]|nr:hypothetical protein Bbelb_260350 [Branchiostoma belcheri]